MMTYICTLEHPTEQPKVIRGTAPDPDRCAKQAFRAAEKLYPRFLWVSLVLVIETPMIPATMTVKAGIHAA